jgi:hypothetical protein
MMEYWNNGKMGKEKDRRNNGTTEKRLEYYGLLEARSHGMKDRKFFYVFEPNIPIFQLSIIPVLFTQYSSIPSFQYSKGLVQYPMGLK